MRKVARPSDVPRRTISLAAGWGHEWTLAVALGGLMEEREDGPLHQRAEVKAAV